jgi:hypothetical protein
MACGCAASNTSNRESSRAESAIRRWRDSRDSRFLEAAPDGGAGRSMPCAVGHEPGRTGRAAHAKARRVCGTASILVIVTSYVSRNALMQDRHQGRRTTRACLSMIQNPAAFLHLQHACIDSSPPEDLAACRSGESVPGWPGNSPVALRLRPSICRILAQPLARRLIRPPARPPVSASAARRTISVLGPPRSGRAGAGLSRPSSRPISSVIRPFSTLKQAIPVNPESARH